MLSNIIEKERFTTILSWLKNKIGNPKVTITKKRLLDINPDAHIVTHHTEWNESIGTKMSQGYDFIVEAFDHVD